MEKYRIKGKLKYYKFFSEYIPDLKSNTIQQKVKCPFSDHEDKEDSFSVNLEKGLYNCFGCGRSGDIYKFYMTWHYCSFQEAKYAITGDARIPILSEAEVDEAHAELLRKPNTVKALGYNRGWTIETIEKFKLGWNEKEKRIYIPIRNEKDELINIRKYDAFHALTKNKFIGIKGHNSPYFFPIKNLMRTDVDIIMLMAGEPDTILACQYEMIAGTFTGGEGSFNRNLLPLFRKKKVYICYDRDLAGVRATESLADELLNYAEKVKIIDLPFEVI